MEKQLPLFTLYLTIVAALLLLTSSNTYAVNYKNEYRAKPLALPPPMVRKPVNTGLKDGFYIGLEAGYDSYKVNKNLNAAAGGLTVMDDSTMNATGLVGGLLAGYGRYFKNSIYLGGEIAVNISAANQTNNNTTIEGADTITETATFNANTSYSFSFRPGVKLYNYSLAYLRLGYSIANFEGEHIESLNNVYNFNSSKSNWSNGFVYGLGLEVAVNNYVSMRGEYTHTDYSTFTVPSGTKFSPSNNQFLLAAIFHVI